MYARKFKIYFRVYEAYKRVLLEPLFKVNIQKFVLLNHSCVKLTKNRFLLTSFFFCPATTLMEYSHAVLYTLNV